MTWFHFLQCAFSLALLVVILRRSKVLFIEAPLDGPRFFAAIRGAGDEERSHLLKRAGGAWAARALRQAFGPTSDPDYSSFRELFFDLRYQAFDGLLTIRNIGRAAAGLGLVGVAIEILWVLNGNHGLLALQVGRVESMAASHGLLSLVLGAGTSALALLFLREARKMARSLVSDLSEAKLLVEPEEEAQEEVSQGLKTQ